MFGSSNFRFATLGLAGWMWGCIGFAHAAESPTVGISFELLPPRYQANFSPARLPEVQATIAAALATALARPEDFPKLQFLRFRPAAAPGKAPDAQLRIILDRGPNRTDPDHVETLLAFALTGPGVRPEETPPVRFRGKENYNIPINDPAQGVTPFIDEIRRVLRAEEQTLRKVFSNVPVAQNDGALLDGLRWVLPFKDSSSCMSEGSTLMIENEAVIADEMRTPRITVEARGILVSPLPAYEKFRGCISTAPSPLKNQPDLADLKKVKASTVRVKAIYVLEHKPKVPCPASISPRDLLPKETGS